MKILFHPSFDNGYYIDLSKGGIKTLGTKIVGMAGLLEHLSLHNGLSGHYVSDGERAAAYLSHVSTCAKDTMIEDSFKNDALGVAKCLLRWRDLLIMAGWKPFQNGNDNTPKLSLLSQIETSWKAQVKGTADRWLELAELAQKITLVNESDVIECKCMKEALPRLVQDVLVSCKASFLKSVNDVYLPETANIKVKHYTDLSDAYRYVAAHMQDYEKAVIINRDNVSLNHILFSWGKPLTGATIQESNPLTLQLFKLAMAVFSRPLNIQNILSYLQLPVGPVPRKLRSALAKVLITDGGFGNIDWNDLTDDKAQKIREAGITTKWDLAIYNYINEEEEKEEVEEEVEKEVEEEVEEEEAKGKHLTKVERESKTTLLKYITDPSFVKNEPISTSILRDYIGSINKWASPIANNEEEKDEMLKSQLSTVVSYFKQLSDALDGITDISYQDLEKHVRTIYQPTTITQARAQVGSLRVISSCTQILDTPDNLVWLDCCGADEIIDQYEFLSSSERTWLNSQEGIDIPRLQDILAINRKEMIMSLSKITGNITLVTADYHHNQKMAEHPIVAELKMQRGNGLEIEEGSIDLPLSENMDIHKIEPKLQYILGEIKYTGRDESNTSIDTLINYPFDYTAHYVADLGETSKNELGSIQKITGLVAHNFIESLMNSVAELPKNSRVDSMSELLHNEFNSRLENAIMTTGLSLMLKENEVEYNNLRYQLKRSVEVLITIMKKMLLVPMGCEIKYTKSLGSPINKFNARIDMELEDAQGKAVIFDFKWTYSDYYGKKIKDGNAIQLELYRKELELQGKEVGAVGYYLLPKCLLETPNYPTLKDDNGKVIISHIEPPHDANLFTQIKNSVEQRLNEMHTGNIEEGEGMDIKGLSYSQKLLEGKEMLIVGTPKRERKTKANPNPLVKEIWKESNKVFTNKPESRFFKKYTEFEDSNTPLNEKPTTYPLLKGRLK